MESIGVTEHDAVPLMKQYRIDEHPLLSRTWRNNIVDFERGMWLGRTPFRWFLLMVFFMTFYISVTLFVTFNYLIFSYYLPTKHPRWVLDQPGLSMQPSFHTLSMLKIQYMPTIFGDIERIVNHISMQHDRYGDPPKEYYENCSFANSYGYHSRKPCFFLKVNKVIKFKPKTYTNIKEMPKITPPDLLSYIKNQTMVERDRRVWLGCKTKPHIELQYIPRPFVSAADLTYHISVRYFGNRTNNANDESQTTFFDTSDFNRIIAVRPRKDLQWNKEYEIQCFIFAKNIIIKEHPSMYRGTIRFKVKVVDPNMKQ